MEPRREQQEEQREQETEKQRGQQLQDQSQREPEHSTKSNKVEATRVRNTSHPSISSLSTGQRLPFD